MKRQVRVFGRTIPLLVPIVAALMIGSFAIGSYIYDMRMLSMTASIRTIGELTIWFDPECTQSADGYDWGEFDVLVGDEEKSVELWIKSESNMPLVVTWTLIDEGWAFDGPQLYSLYYPDSTDPHWRLNAVIETSETWIPEESTAPSAAYEMYLEAWQVRSSRFTLNAFQSDGVYADLSFQLRLTAWDTYS